MCSMKIFGPSSQDYLLLTEYPLFKKGVEGIISKNIHLTLAVLQSLFLGLQGQEGSFPLQIQPEDLHRFPLLLFLSQQNQKSWV